MVPTEFPNGRYECCPQNSRSRGRDRIAPVSVVVILMQGFSVFRRRLTWS